MDASKLSAIPNQDAGNERERRDARSLPQPTQRLLTAFPINYSNFNFPGIVSVGAAGGLEVYKTTSITYPLEQLTRHWRLNSLDLPISLGLSHCVSNDYNAIMLYIMLLG